MRVGLDQAGDVLAPVAAADVEEEVIADPRELPLEDLRGFLPRRDHRGHLDGGSGVDHRDPVLIETEVLHGIGRRALGHRQDVVGHAHDAEPREPAREVERVGIDVVLGEDQRDQVVQGDHEPHARPPGPVRPLLLQRHRGRGPLEWRGDVVDRRLGVRLGAPAAHPAQLAGALEEVHRGRHREEGRQPDRVDDVGGDAQQRLGRLRGLTGDAAFEVGRVLAALDVDPDAPVWQRHQSEEPARLATTIRSATTQPVRASSSDASSEPFREPLPPDPPATPITSIPSSESRSCDPLQLGGVGPSGRPHIEHGPETPPARIPVLQPVHLGHVEAARGERDTGLLATAPHHQHRAG